jgi:hypothetical protein
MDIKKLFDENVKKNNLVQQVEKNLEYVRQISEQVFTNFDIGYRFEPSKGNIDEPFGYDIFIGKGNNSLYFRVSSNGINFNNSIYRKGTDKKLILEVIKFCNERLNRLP